MGYLRLPIIESAQAFWVGFLAGLSAMLFVGALVFAWRKNSAVTEQIRKAPDSDKGRRSYGLLWLVVGAFILFGGTLSGLMIHRQSELFEASSALQDLRIREQAELVESIRKSNQGFLMGNVLDKLDRELEQNPSGKLSDGLIGRVVALSYSLKPYRHLEGDTLSRKMLSPERGQLLMALVHMDMDSTSMNRIRSRARFFGADLRGVQLPGANLSGIDLEGADLENANLKGANLHGANLSWANLWGADLDSSNLSNSNLRRSNLSWAELNHCDLRMSNLNGADLSNAKFRASDLTNSLMQWANAEAAMFTHAKMVRVDMFGTNFTRANLSYADLTEGNLVATCLVETDLHLAKMNDVSCNGDFFEHLIIFRISGSELIKENYRLNYDSVRRYESAKFRLVRIQ